MTYIYQVWTTGGVNSALKGYAFEAEGGIRVVWLDQDGEPSGVVEWFRELALLLNKHDGLELKDFHQVSAVPAKVIDQLEASFRTDTKVLRTLGRQPSGVTVTKVSNSLRNVTVSGSGGITQIGHQS